MSCMSQLESAPFYCPHCGAKYRIARLEVPPTHDREIRCISCSGALPGREGAFLLKYFLVERSVAQRSS